MTYLELALKVLEASQKPMTSTEVWDFAVEHHWIGQLDSIGKTPWTTLNASMGAAYNANPGHPLLRTDDKPMKYYLAAPETFSPDPQEEPEPARSFVERDLHPLLTRFVANDPRFHCVTRTIFHENSAKGTKGETAWLHPDLVGFYFPYRSYLKETLDVARYFSANQYRFYSFEMKREVNFTNLREYYFQAVSNSSWANEGYLVALKFSFDPEFREELSRLNRAFGIGVIELNPEDVERSQILYPARRNEIDWSTINRLAVKNSDFRGFLHEVIADIKAEKSHKEGYDRVFSRNELRNHIESHGIKVQRTAAS